ncbi:hypothetical protein L484_017304 [Morus notabilis]|uniref:Uncharacterized protein n=1 Tax=Morus notabilis TaxID=981085 RepID=W9S0U5_9ROSA|nr:hypothetical protein L484_017304 [Morus notabilis]
MDGVKGGLQKIPAREKNVMLILGKLDLLMRNQGEKSPGIKGTLEDLPSSHSKRTVEDGGGGGSGTGLNQIIELAQRVEDRNMALKVAKGTTSSTWIRQQPHIQPFRSQSASLLKASTPNDKSYGLSPNDKLFSPRGMPSVRHFSEIPVGLGPIRAIATRNCNTEGPDSGRIWTGSGDSSELEWDPC